MSVRDLFNNREYVNTYNSPSGSGRGRSRGNGIQRFISQLMIAGLIFACILYCYDHDTKAGEAVRFVVAMATTEDGDMLAVNGNLFGGTDSDQDLVGEAPAELDTSAAYAGVENAEGKLSMVLPVSGVMQKAFGEISPEGGVAYGGIDILCESEQQVKACAPGTITNVEGSAGNYSIEIKHNDKVKSKYVGLSAASVAIGDQVKQGDLIGTVAADSTLFLGVYENELAVDPFAYLEGPTAN